MNPASEKSPDAVTDAGWLNWLPRIAGTLALFLVIGYALTFRALPANANPAAWGAFGDYIGGLLNPLISLFTLIVAMKVWKLQKNELLETRKAMEEQGKTAEQQRQEQRFFDLLNIYQRTVDSTTHLTMWAKVEPGYRLNSSPEIQTSESAHFRGKEAFATRLRELMNEPYFKASLRSFFNGNFLDQSTAENDIRNRLKMKWRESEHAMLLDCYFRVVFRILAELEETLGDQHDRYSKLLRAQFSRAELHLLGLHLWLGEDDSKRMSLAEKYGLLKHLPQGDFRSILLFAFPPPIFGEPLAEPVIETQKESHAD